MWSQRLISNTNYIVDQSTWICHSQICNLAKIHVWCSPSVMKPEIFPGHICLPHNLVTSNVTTKLYAFQPCLVWSYAMMHTVYPNKYAHGFVVLCFVVVMQSFIMNSHEVFIHIHQGCFASTGAIVRLPQCQWSKPDGYGKISQCITTTKHSKAKTVCIFLGIYCRWHVMMPWHFLESIMMNLDVLDKVLSGCADEDQVIPRHLNIQ